MDFSDLGLGICDISDYFLFLSTSEEEKIIDDQHLYLNILFQKWTIGQDW